jgi:hypothetical protein
MGLDWRDMVVHTVLPFESLHGLCASKKGRCPVHVQRQ